MNRVLSLFAVITFVLVYGAALVYTTQGRGQSGGDFAAYYLAAKAMQHGENIYTLSEDRWKELADENHIEHVEPPYRYPPLLAGVIGLFSSLPPHAAIAVWNGLNIIALMATGFVLSQLMSQRWVDPLVFAALTFYVPNLTTLYAGQANIPVLLGLAFYLFLFERKRTYAGGLSLAASIFIKPIAAPLALHLLWRRDARIVALMVGLLSMCVVTILLTGPQASLNYWQNIWNITPISISGLPVTYPPNQSLFGFFGRLLTMHEYGASLGNNPALARALSLGTIALLLLGVVFLTWSQNKTGHDTFSLETGLVLVTINLVVPVSWYHHLAISLISLLVAWQTSRSRNIRTALVAAFVLIGVQGLWHQFEGHTLLLSLGTYGLLIVYIVTALNLFHIKQPAAQLFG